MSKPYERKWDNATKEDVAGALAAMEHAWNKDAARALAANAARALAQFFYERLSDEAGELREDREIMVSPALLHKYVHLVLRRIVVEGWTAAQATGFQPRPGRPEADNQDRDIEIAFFVRQAMKTKSWGDAIATAADEFHKSGKTIEKAYTDYHKYLPPDDLT